MFKVAKLDKPEREVDLDAVIMNSLDLESLKKTMLSKLKMTFYKETTLAAKVVSYACKKSSELTLDQLVRFLSVLSKLDINITTNTDQNAYARPKVFVNEILKSNNPEVVMLLISEAILRGDFKSLQMIKDAGQLNFDLDSFSSYIEKTVHIYTDDWKKLQNGFFDESTWVTLQEMLTEQFRIGRNIILSLEHMDFLPSFEITKFYAQIKTLHQPSLSSGKEKSGVFTEQMKITLGQIKNEISYFEEGVQTSDQKVVAAPINSLFFHDKEIIEKACWIKVDNKEYSGSHHYLCSDGNMKDSTIIIREASELIKECSGTISIKLSKKTNIHDLARLDEELAKLSKLANFVNRYQVSKGIIYSDFIYVFGKGDDKSKDFALSIDCINSISAIGDDLKEDILQKIILTESSLSQEAICSFHC